MTRDIYRRVNSKRVDKSTLLIHLVRLILAKLKRQLSLRLLEADRFARNASEACDANLSSGAKRSKFAYKKKNYTVERYVRIYTSVFCVRTFSARILNG